MTDAIRQPSFPRRRESRRLSNVSAKRDNTSNTALSASRRLFDKLDSRFRRNDNVVGFATIALIPSVVFIYVKLNKLSTCASGRPASVCLRPALMLKDPPGMFAEFDRISVRRWIWSRRETEGRRAPVRLARS